jgi:hypothetical protein
MGEMALQRGGAFDISARGCFGWGSIPACLAILSVKHVAGFEKVRADLYYRLCGCKASLDWDTKHDQHVR